MFRSGFRKSARKGFRTTPTGGHSNPIAADEQISIVAANYLLYDTFSDARSPGFISGTLPVVGGARVVTDTNSKLSIAGGVASFATGGVGAGNPGLWYPSAARVFGKTLIFSVTPTQTDKQIQIGWDTNQSGDLDSGNTLYFQNNGTILSVNNSAISVVANYTTTIYQVALTMRTSGVYLFIKGGAFANWVLLWQSALVSTASMFPGFTPGGGTTSVFTADNIRVPVALYNVPVLVYDTFTRANGALGSTEAAGADAQTVTARAWTGATFAIASNVAVNTPTLGADVIVNGNFATDTDWTKGSGWTIAAGVATRVPDAGSTLLYENIATIDHWYQIVWTLSTYVAGSFQGRLGNRFGPARSSAATFIETGLAITTNAAGIQAGATASGAVDNISVKSLTLSELFASLQSSTADVLADVNVTGPTATAGIQAGLVCNLDSAASPANFVIAYLGGNGTAYLDKCVAGVYTNVISAAVTYSAGATLRVIKSGTSYRLFYNSLVVGSVASITDVGIVSNTIHGIFSTSSSNSCDNLQIMASGTGNEYSWLDSV